MLCDRLSPNEAFKTVTRLLLLTNLPASRGGPHSPTSASGFLARWDHPRLPCLVESRLSGQHKAPLSVWRLSGIFTRPRREQGILVRLCPMVQPARDMPLA